jgi:hypothetical protein
LSKVKLTPSAHTNIVSFGTTPIGIHSSPATACLASHAVIFSGGNIIPFQSQPNAPTVIALVVFTLLRTT